MLEIIDTHAHITCEELYPQAEELLARAQEAGVAKILCICLHPREAYKAFQLQERYNWLDIAVGFHPCDLYEVSEQDWQDLETLMQDERIIALGEIGLDYHWDDVDKETQKQGFIRQLEMANKYQKPVLIHMREATKDTMDLLREYKQVPGIMHCYSGSLETAKQAIAMDMYISVGGPLTFKNARGIPEVMEQLPIERIFVETDCPYLTPHPFRGKRNEPMYITYTFEKLCEVKQCSKEELAAQMKVNYQTLFHKQ